MGVSRDCPSFKVPHIISGTGKSTDVKKIGRYIHRVHLNKSPLKSLDKRERGVTGVSRDCRSFTSS